MTGKVKLASKLILYTYKARLNLILAGIVLASAVAMEIFFGCSGQADQFMGGFYMAFGGIILVQLWQQLNMNGFTAASPKSRSMKLRIPILLTAAGSLGGYVVVALIRGIFLALGKLQTVDVCRGLLNTAVIYFLLMLYMAVCYKYFYAASAFILVMIPFLAFWGRIEVLGVLLWCWEPLEAVRSSFPFTLLVGFGILAAGVGGHAFLSWILRKKPIDKISMGAVLRRA